MSRTALLVRKAEPDHLALKPWLSHIKGQTTIRWQPDWATRKRHFFDAGEATVAGPNGGTDDGTACARFRLPPTCGEVLRLASKRSTGMYFRANDHDLGHFTRGYRAHQA
ncbi:hypothetical protein GGTG_13646 [Gaeumannomyces tritici R3-111a-1]|uniref:Uncharacterized protein n=1 Tax=Gaeumannomyces tritici (strain R3-111a-1) TaxID=644352 RepID=J3PJG4_GAET3|nr:hypothetical protein GGTG_13646 [Gaeumannomyces tritici R3-111a-1]EJT68782.1 hypothetical protein GGTG_13646 [Gaeumannomyces tritici R3-111a-1]